MLKATLPNPKNGSMQSHHLVFSFLLIGPWRQRPLLASTTSPATTKMQQRNSVNSFQGCWLWHSTGTVSTRKMVPFFGWKELQSSGKANDLEKS